MKKLFLFVLLLLVTILPRFLFLNNVPVAINNDELHYTLNAKSFFLTGKDISGKISPLDTLLFRYPNGDTIQAELPYFLEMPIFGPFNFSLAGLVIPSAVLGVLTVVLVYLITKKLFDENTAFVAGFLAAINPWLIFLSRSSYEGGFATCLFLLVFYLLLITKSWKIILCFPFALLAFYSNIGTKLIFVPFMLLSTFYAYRYINKGKYLKQYVLLFALSLLLTLFFVFQIKQASGSRTSEVLLPNDPRIIQQVNDMRKATITNPLMGVSENKYYVYLTILTKNAFNAVSPYYLFAGGDYFYLIGIHGIFYYIDALLVLIGMLAMFMYKKRDLIFLSLFAGLSLLPQVFHDSTAGGNFTHHIVLLIPFLIFIISFGIRKSIVLIKDKKLKLLLKICFVLAYSFLFMNFLNAYFFRFPLQEGTFEIKERILSKYMSLAKNSEKNINVYSSYPILAFKEFLFYTNSYNKNNLKELNKLLIQGNYTYNNIKFLRCDKNLKLTKDTLSIEDLNCNERSLDNFITIVQIKDNGIVYRIYNDKICSKYNLPQFLPRLKLSDLNVEKLSEENFCKTFIVKY